MEARQIPLVLVLAACVAMLVAVPVVGIGADGGAATQVDNNTTNETTDANESFGGQVSAFMQTSAVDANTTVEDGMFNAAVNTSESPEKEVTSRADRLERQRQRLEQKAARLKEKRANGTLPAVAYTAQASALRERIVNLQEQINGTETAAKRVGVNVSSLDRLRTQAANMTGPEVSAVARNITDAPRGPPADVPGGPPGDAGPAGNESGPPGDAGPPGNQSGPPSNTGPAGNQSGPAGNQSGPPGDTGPAGNESSPAGNESGPPDDTSPAGNESSPVGNESGPAGDESSPAGNESGTPEATGPSTDDSQTPGSEESTTESGTQTGTPTDPQSTPDAPSDQSGTDQGPQTDRR